METNVMAPVYRRVYSVAEAATILNLPVRTVYLAVERGLIPSVRLGRRILIPTAAIDGLLFMPLPASMTSPGAVGVNDE